MESLFRHILLHAIFGAFWFFFLRCLYHAVPYTW